MLYAVLLLISCLMTIHVGFTSAQPNIILIVADDLGYGDLGVYGSKDIKTPQFDKLAQEGVRFTQFYSNGPECTPTRVSLLSGRYPQWARGLECAIGSGNVGRYDEAEILAEKNELGLSPALSVIPSKLKEAGYSTAIIGKWHLGYEKKFRPLKHGFDFSLGPIGYGGDFFHHIEQVENFRIDDFKGNYPMARNDVQHFREGYYMTHLFTDEAIAWINQQRFGKPFFLYLPYTVPHNPLQGPDDYQEEPVTVENWNKNSRDTYVTMVEDFDLQIGRILKQLDRQNLTENTIIIFISDNGPTSSGDTGTLRGSKGQVFEGGIRVPCIIKWPGKIRAGIISDQQSIGMDLTYSILKHAGINNLSTLNLEGIDLLGHVMDKQQDYDRTLFWRRKRGNTSAKAVRFGNWKYIQDDRNGDVTEYLFNLGKDVSESNNLLLTNIEQAKRMRNLLDEWEKKVDVHKIN
jgi:arylsulfatase A-like enzyme